jgi:hypothetical protein
MIAKIVLYCCPKNVTKWIRSNALITSTRRTRGHCMENFKTGDVVSCSNSPNVVSLTTFYLSLPLSVSLSHISKLWCFLMLLQFVTELGKACSLQPIHTPHVWGMAAAVNKKCALKYTTINQCCCWHGLFSNQISFDKYICFETTF